MADVTAPHVKKQQSLSTAQAVKVLQSPHPHLLTSNFPPTEDERADLVDVIGLAETSLERLEKKLSGKKWYYPRWRLRPIREKHICVTEYISQHRAVLSTLRFVPPEVLQLIFLEALSTLRYTPFLEKLNINSDFPWVLTRVSQFWRNVALNTPKLWTEFPKINLHDASRSRRRCDSIIMVLLERSQPLPIDLFITEHPSSTNDNSYFQTLLSCSSRWRKLHISVHEQTLAFFRTIEGRLPLLEELNIFTWKHPYISPVSVGCFRTAPRLRRIEVFGSPYTDILLATPSHPSPWVHDFSVDPPKYTFDPSFIEELRVVDLGSNRFLPQRSVVLPKLVSLKIQFSSHSDDPHYLLQYLDLPCLEELRVVSIDASIISNISSMIMRSSTPCLLKNIYIRAASFLPGELTTLLLKTPLVTHLCVSLPTIHDILSLAGRTHEHPVAPLLQVCVFYVGGTLPEDKALALNTFATSRCDVSYEFPGGDEAILGSTQVPLRAIYLRFSTGSTIFQQRLLHHWPATTNAFSLAGHRESVKNMVTHFLQSAHHTSNTNHSALHSVISLIGGIDIKHASEIYRSAIHIDLFRLADHNPTSNSSLQSLCDFSRRTLHKWQPLFEADIDNFRWAMQLNSLVYISNSNPLRFSKCPTKMVFGVDDGDFGPLYSPCSPDDCQQYLPIV